MTIDLSPGTAEDRLAVVSSDVAGLALPLLVTTQAAALACLPLVGRGDPKAADGVAVAALREALARLPGRARVVIGEGEKDDAPMLFSGEELGTGGAVSLARPVGENRPPSPPRSANPSTSCAWPSRTGPATGSWWPTCAGPAPPSSSSGTAM